MPNPADMALVYETTRASLEETGSVVDLSSNLQDYVVARRIVGNYDEMDNKSASMAKFALEAKPERGAKLEWYVTTESYDTVETVPVTFAPPVSPTIKNVQATASVSWGAFRQSIMWDRTLAALNGGDAPESLVNLIKTQILSANTGWANFVETAFLGGPTTLGEYGDGTMLGMNYWMQASMTTGFNGAAPSWANNLVADLNVASATTGNGRNFRNYTAGYSAFNQDFIDMISRAKSKTFFQSIPQASSRFGSLKRIPMKAPQKDCMASLDTILQCRKLQQQRNDNIGGDPAWYDNNYSVAIAGCMMTWWPILDADSDTREQAGIDLIGTEPIYMLSWPAWKWVPLEGFGMKEDAPANMPNQPDIFVVNRATKAQIKCLDRRSQAVFVQAVA